MLHDCEMGAGTIAPVALRGGVSVGGNAAVVRGLWLRRNYTAGVVSSCRFVEPVLTFDKKLRQEKSGNMLI